MASKKPKFRFLGNGSRRGAPSAISSRYGRVSALDGGAGEFFWYWSGTFDSRQAALDAMASPEGLAGAADVPNYYHDVPLFMFFER
jgi:hypothetical protein